MSELERYLASRGIKPEMAERFGLRWDEERRAIAIPYRTAYGDVVTVRYRSLDGGPKYLAAPGSTAHLFNVEATDHSPVYIAEGEFDAIVLTQLGLHAVGVPGVTSWRREWRWLFLDSEVWIVFDGDDAGRRGAQRVAQSLAHVASDVRIVDLPDGHDVNSLWLEEPELLEELLGLAVS